MPEGSSFSKKIGIEKTEHFANSGRQKLETESPDLGSFLSQIGLAAELFAQLFFDSWLHCCTGHEELAEPVAQVVYAHKEANETMNRITSKFREARSRLYRVDDADF